MKVTPLQNMTTGTAVSRQNDNAVTFDPTRFTFDVTGKHGAKYRSWETKKNLSGVTHFRVPSKHKAVERNLTFLY